MRLLSSKDVWQEGLNQQPRMTQPLFIALLNIGLVVWPTLVSSPFLPPPPTTHLLIQQTHRERLAREETKAECARIWEPIGVHVCAYVFENQKAKISEFMRRERAWETEAKGEVNSPDQIMNNRKFELVDSCKGSCYQQVAFEKRFNCTRWINSTPYKWGSTKKMWNQESIFSHIWNRG